MTFPFDRLPPRIHAISADVSALTDWARAVRDQEPSSVIRFLRGKKMLSEGALFDEISAAFQFPHYFGENWDALDECLGDLSWLRGRSYLTIVTDAARVLANEAEGFATFVGLLSDVGDEWSEARPELRPWAPEARPFHVIFNDVPTNVVALEARLRKAGVAFTRNSLKMSPTS